MKIRYDISLVKHPTDGSSRMRENTKKRKQKKLEIGLRIRKARKSYNHGLGMNQSEAAKKLGWPLQVWNAIEKGKLDPGVDGRIFKIARILDSDPEYLYEGIERYAVIVRNGKTVDAVEYRKGCPSIQYYSPVITWEEAGKSVFSRSDVKKSKGREYVPYHTRSHPDSFVLIMHGNSMESTKVGEPSFLDGDELHFDPVQKTPPAGKYVIARKKNSRSAVFRKLVMDFGELYLEANNHQYPTVQVTDDIHIFGVLSDRHSY